MSLFRVLMPFMAGFFRGYVEEYARPDSGGRTPSARGYDFRQHMTQLARACSMTLTRLQNYSARFTVSVRGSSYTILALFFGSEIEVSVWSNCVFPHGQAPVQEVRDLNPGFSLVEDDEGDVFREAVRLSVEDVTPAAFLSIIGELVPHIVALDISLRNNGFVR
jgi:hypothetical protein